MRRLGWPDRVLLLLVPAWIGVFTPAIQAGIEGRMYEGGARGYTGFAERRSAEEAFTAVSRYTEAVSRVVRAHGGSVVEFHGDGLMAVFGAPAELAHKERAAVEAARAIVPTVAALREAGAGPLAVGVGVATGPALVGDIRTADRAIWGAIGNTTNLADRLQQCTREFDAAVVVDDATWRAAGEAAKAFERHPAVRVRGRSEPLDVFILPRFSS